VDTISLRHKNETLPFAARQMELDAMLSKISQHRATNADVLFHLWRLKCLPEGRGVKNSVGEGVMKVDILR
jgi:hypothetical protein